MKQPVIVGVDIDGVLADYTSGLAKKLYQATGKALAPPGYQPACWEWPTNDLGYTTAEYAEAQRLQDEDTAFWRELGILPGVYGFLRALDYRVGRGVDEVYFMTVRGGVAAKTQTERWLSDYGFFKPTVLIARGDKGSLAKGLGLTHFLDDRPKNVLDVLHASPKTKAYLLGCKHNALEQFTTMKAGATVIEKLSQFSDVFATPTRLVTAA